MLQAHIIISETARSAVSENKFYLTLSHRRYIMNCLCNIFDEDNIWILILVLVILFILCNGCGCGCGGYARNNNGNGCGCGCN